MTLVIQSTPLYHLFSFLLNITFTWWSNMQYINFFNSIFFMHDFSVTITRCYTDAYVNSFFHRLARPWNSLPAECFSLTCNLNGFHSRVNRNLSSFSFFTCFSSFSFSVICNSTPCSGCYALRGVNLNWKKFWQDLRETTIT